MDRRTQAREIAMQALYQLDAQGDDILERLEVFFRQRCDQDDMVHDLAKKWTRETWENLKVCDELIEAAAIKWHMSRLCGVDRSILRLSTYQLRFCEDIPGRVVINEAIEIAKKYSSDQSPKFVNGVLDAIMQKLKGSKQET